MCILKEQMYICRNFLWSDNVESVFKESAPQTEVVRVCDISKYQHFFEQMIIAL